MESPGLATVDMVCVVLVLWSMVCNAKSVDSELVVRT